MTLKSRLLLSSLVLSLATTLVLAWLIRDAWQGAERQRFEQQFQVATAELTAQLERSARSIQQKLEPLCEHDPLVDSVLIGHHTGDLQARLLPAKLSLPEQRQALSLDELALISDSGELLAGTLAQASATSPPQQLRQRVERASASAGLRPELPLAFEAACKAQEESSWVALVGAVQIEPLLNRASRRHGLELEVRDVDQPRARDRDAQLVASVALPTVGNRLLIATRSQISLQAIFSGLNWTIFTALLPTLLVSLFLAWLLARGISKPVVAFAERTRKAVQGSVEHLPVTGGPELAEAARAFNRTLDDLQSLRMQLQAAERIAARREIARRVAHEIKNPLFPIQTSVETLRKLKGRNPEQFDAFFDEATRTVLEEVRRLSNMVESFSRYAKLPSPQPQQVDLSELTLKLCRLHADLGAEVDCQVQPEVVALIDRDQISQVLMNLLKNALEATGESTKSESSLCRSARIEVQLKTADDDKNRVLIEVCDNGPGVSEEMVPRLFEPYATSKESGTGLGLPISHRIAVEHGGDLTYASRTGGGACFCLQLLLSGPPRLD